MVEMALTQLSEKGVIDLDDERKSVMVSNLMVVLCGERDTQPVVNAGSLYCAGMMAASAKQAFALRLAPALFAAIDRMAAAAFLSAHSEFGSASCRATVCLSVSLSVFSVSLKKHRNPL